MKNIMFTLFGIIISLMIISLVVMQYQEKKENEKCFPFYSPSYSLLKSNN